MLDAIRLQSWLHGQPGADSDSEAETCGIQSIGRYEIQRPLQSGATSSVFVAKDVYTGDVVALKHVKLPNPDDSFNLAEHETWIHQQVDSHPNIVKLRGMSIVSPTEIAIATEYVPGGDLFDAHQDMAENFTLDDFFGLTLQITSALKHMHSLGFAHCDIKPENCLISPCRTRVKLADFGSSRHVSEIGCVRTQGTTGFASPEEMVGRRLRDHRPGDVWALGVTVFNLLTGDLPFAVAHLSDPDFAAHMRKRRRPEKAPLWRSLPAGLDELVEGMLSIDRRQRPTISEVHDELLRLQTIYLGSTTRRLSIESFAVVQTSPDQAQDEQKLQKEKMHLATQGSRAVEAMLGS